MAFISEDMVEIMPIMVSRTALWVLSTSLPTCSCLLSQAEADTESCCTVGSEWTAPELGQTQKWDVQLKHRVKNRVTPRGVESLSISVSLSKTVITVRSLTGLEHNYRLFCCSWIIRLKSVIIGCTGWDQSFNGRRNSCFHTLFGVFAQEWRGLLWSTTTTTTSHQNKSQVVQRDVPPSGSFRFPPLLCNNNNSLQGENKIQLKQQEEKQICDRGGWKICMASHQVVPLLAVNGGTSGVFTINTK